MEEKKEEFRPAQAGSSLSCHPSSKLLSWNEGSGHVPREY